MKFTVLQEKFIEKNPSGAVRFTGKAYKVTFEGQGKVYTYKASSHYSLAARLDLIPDIDIHALAKVTLGRLVNGEGKVVAASGLSDTMRFLHRGEGHIVSKATGQDQWGRQTSEYSIDHSSDPWII